MSKRTQCDLHRMDGELLLHAAKVAGPVAIAHVGELERAGQTMPQGRKRSLYGQPCSTRRKPPERRDLGRARSMQRVGFVRHLGVLGPTIDSFHDMQLRCVDRREQRLA